MRKKNSIGIVSSALLVLTLGACSAGGDSPRYATGVETEKRNRVEMVRMPFLLLAEAEGGDEMSASSLRGINGFLADIELRYGDVLLIDRGAGVSPERIEGVTGYFRRLGIEIGETDGVFGPAPASGNLVLYIERYIVELPDCPDFSSPSTPNYQNAATANLGCSNVTALGLMIADPRDLVDGRTDRAPKNAERATRAVKAVRSGN